MTGSSEGVSGSTHGRDVGLDSGGGVDVVSECVGGGVVGDFGAVGGDAHIFMAVSMLCAMTHPTIFSLSLDDDDDEDERRKRYALDFARSSGGKSGAERATLTV